MSELEQYWEQKDYGSGDNYKVGAAIEFQEWPESLLDTDPHTGNGDGDGGSASPPVRKRVAYRIRMNESAASLLGIGGTLNFPSTTKFISDSRSTSRYAEEYSDSGFLSLQLLVDNWILGALRNGGDTGVPQTMDGVSGPGTIEVPTAVGMPTRFYEYDSFWTRYIFMLLNISVYIQSCFSVQGSLN
jgi:hypothetical protein